MIGITDILVYAAIGGTVAELLLFVGLVLLWTYDLHTRVKEDVGPLRHVYAVLRWTPPHIIHQTDWKQMGRMMAGTYLVVYALTIPIMLMAVGITVIV